MKDITTLLTVIALALITACKPSNGDDLSGEYIVNGIVFINDTLRGISEEIILKDQAVQIKQAKDRASSNFFRKVVSNQQGRFLFTNLYASDYYLSARYELNGLTFSNELLVNPKTMGGDVKIILYPDASQNNILSIITRDNETRGILTNAKVCLFSSKLVADSNACGGSFWNKNTDSFGRATNYKLHEGWYYINAQDSVGRINLKTKDSVLLGKNGLVQKTLLLK